MPQSSQPARDRDKRVDLLALLLIATLALALRGWQIAGAEPVVGEAAQLATARIYLENLKGGEGGADRWRGTHPYGPLSNWLHAAAAPWGNDLSTLRWANAIIGALTCGLLFWVGRDLVGRWVGLVGAGVCLVMPQVVAYHRVAGVEACSALLYLLSVWFFFLGLRRGSNNWWYPLAGLCAGLALAARLANASVLLVLPAMYLVAEGPAIWRERRLALPLSMLLTPLLALGVLVAVWPYLWRSPDRWATALLALPAAEQAAEALARSAWAPIATMPVAALVALCFGLGRALLRRTVGQLCLLLWAFGPLLVLLLPTSRGGVRDAYPALIPACLLVGLGVDALARLGARLVAFRLHLQLSTLLAVALAIYLLQAGLSVHPDLATYRGELAGWLLRSPAAEVGGEPRSASTRPAGRPSTRPTSRPSTRPAGRPSTQAAGRPSARPTDAL